MKILSASDWQSIVDDNVLEIEGVFKDVPDNTHFHFEFLVSYVTMKANENPESEYYTWADFGHFNYIKLREGASPKLLEDHLMDCIQKHIDLDAVDAALRSGRILRLYQRDHDLKKFEPLIRKVADQALISVLGRLDGPEDLENIVLVGGGAYLYRKAVKRRFPKHQILEVEDPMYANVRGFQLLGEQYVRERPDQFRQVGDSQAQGPVAA